MKSSTWKISTAKGLDKALEGASILPAHFPI